MFYIMLNFNSNVDMILNKSNSFDIVNKGFLINLSHHMVGMDKYMKCTFHTQYTIKTLMQFSVNTVLCFFRD